MCILFFCLTEPESSSFVLGYGPKVSFLAIKLRIVKNNRFFINIKKNYFFFSGNLLQQYFMSAMDAVRIYISNIDHAKVR